MRARWQSIAAALCLALAVLAVSNSAVGLRRSTGRIERALRYACPGLSKGTARSYARIIQSEAQRRSFDPYTQIAIIWNETGGSCNAGLTFANDSGFYVGLGQIDANNSRSCRDGGLDSPACQQRIANLKDGAFNLRRTAHHITENRKFCRSKTGEPALFARWLSSYQGFNNHAKSGRSGVWCNMRQDRRGRWRDVKTPSLTRRVMNYRRRLVRLFG